MGPVKSLDAVGVSIGALSAATGVPVDTLRTWERRYGFPWPIARTEGSHRRYAAETIGVVRLIVKALELGHRPSAVVGRSPEELRRMLGLSGGPKRREEPLPRDRRRVATWLALTRELEAEALSSEFRVGLADMAVIDFLETCMGPYLVELGEAWADGRIRVAQEHFAAERTREFLSEQWRRLSERSSGGGHAVVLASPPGEQHVLGLHMAAWVVALAGARVVFLGADTPMSDVAFAAECHAARGIVLSVAAGYTGDLLTELRELSRRLPRHVSLAVGGEGSWGLEPPARRLNSFFELLRWTEWLGSRPGTG